MRRLLGNELTASFLFGIIYLMEQIPHNNPESVKKPLREYIYPSPEKQEQIQEVLRAYARAAIPPSLRRESLWNAILPEGQESAAEKRTQKELTEEEKRRLRIVKEARMMELAVVGGGAALGFLSVNHITKFLLRKVKGTEDFMKSWEWMEQTILGTKQRA